MKIINEAYAVLSDPVKRLEHDQWIARIENETQYSQADASPAASAANVDYDLVLYPSRKKMGWMFIGSIIFVAIGVVLFIENKNESNWLEGIAKGVTIYLGVPFSGLCGLLFLKRLINPSPSIAINECGIKVMTGGWVTLRWSEIQELEIIEYSNAKFLAIYPTNPEIVSKRQSSSERKFADLSSMNRPPAILIPELFVDMPLEQLMSEVMLRMARN